MARRNRYEMAYARLEDLLDESIADLEIETVIRLKAQGFMDLVVEVLPPCEETGAKLISLAHYFVQNGDLCQDPEMVVRAFPPGSTTSLKLVPSTDRRYGRLEAMTFQQAIPPIYQEVYPQPGRYVPILRAHLNDFLGQWLRNLRSQGHRREDQP